MFVKHTVREISVVALKRRLYPQASTAPQQRSNTKSRQYYIFMNIIFMPCSITPWLIFFNIRLQYDFQSHTFKQHSQSIQIKSDIFFNYFHLNWIKCIFFTQIKSKLFEARKQNKVSTKVLRTKVDLKGKWEWEISQSLTRISSLTPFPF